MKRGSSLRRRVRLARVSAKVKAGEPEYDAVYRRVDERSRGLCEVRLPFQTIGHSVTGHCLARATEHHHVRKPRRTHHHERWVMHICRRHHDECSATFANGRLYTDPNGDGTFTCYYRFKPENPFK